MCEAAFPKRYLRGEAERDQTERRIFDKPADGKSQVRGDYMRTIAVSVALLVFATAAGVAGWMLARRNADEKEMLQGRKRFLYLGYSGALLKRWLLRKLRIEADEETYYREMYVNERPGVKRMEEDCIFGIGILTLAVGLSAVLLANAYSGNFVATRVEQLERPESGTGVARVQAKYRDSRYDLSLALTQRQMTAEEIRENAVHAEEEILNWILGDNESADCVSTPLIFPETVPGTPISIRWSTSDYRIIDYSGKVNTENCGEDGEIVTLTAQMTYGDWEETIQIPVRVCAADSRSNAERRKLEEMLAQTIREQAHEDRIVLPEQIEGTKVEFYKERKTSPWILTAYAALLGVVLSLAVISRRKQRKKDRERQMLCDYPDVVSKLSLLIEAGSTIRTAWERVADDYAGHKERNSERRYAYEEMLHTKNRMSMGIPEETAYEEFGRRCAGIRYLRLSSILVQNLTKGSAGVLPLLQKEAEEAFFDRKEQAKQKGEEAGTKMLLPMAGILVVILAVILIPAFMTL